MQFMNKDMTEAHQYYLSTKDKPRPTFGQQVKIWLPPHGDLGCPCTGCTCYRLSQGTQAVITINVPISVEKYNTSIKPT